MLPIEFFGQNLHFAISLFVALVFFAVFWLYFDAWTERKVAKELWKWIGFLAISVSYVVSATVIEQGVLGASIFGNNSLLLELALRFGGLLAVLYAEIINPLQAVPHNVGIQKESSPPPPPASPTNQTQQPAPAVAVSGSLPEAVLIWTLPLAGLAVAFMYWRRATTGLERHLKPMAIALAIMALSDATHVATLWQQTDDPILYSIVAPFGPLWILEHIFLAAGGYLAGRWVWQYLTKRLSSQLFMILTSMVLGIFLVTTVSFSSLLLSNVQNESLNTLESVGGVLQYAIDGKKAETRANAEVLAQDANVIKSLNARDHEGLVAATTGLLETKKLSDAMIVSSSSQVLLRASEPERWGDSISADTLVQRALIGQEASSIVSKQGVLARQITIVSASPIRVDAKVVGAVVTSVVANDAFVDGIKSRTGLDSAIYSDNVRSATTFVGSNGTSRLIGVKETNPAVASTTLKGGKTYKGIVSQSNEPLLAVYSPLKDINNSVVGMLFVGRPQAAILQAAGRSIELTFLIAVLLLLLSVWPVYYISRYIGRQLK